VQVALAHVPKPNCGIEVLSLRGSVEVMEAWLAMVIGEEVSINFCALNGIVGRKKNCSGQQQPYIVPNDERNNSRGVVGLILLHQGWYWTGVDIST